MLTNMVMLALMIVVVFRDRRFRRYHLLGRWWRSDWPRFIQAPARIKATPPEPAQPLLHLRGVALDPAIDRRMVDRNAAFRQHFLKVAIADRIATIPAHRPQDHITLEMAPLEIRHRSVRPISAKH